MCYIFRLLIACLTATHSLTPARSPHVRGSPQACGGWMDNHVAADWGNQQGTVNMRLCQDGKIVQLNQNIIFYISILNKTGKYLNFPSFATTFCASWHTLERTTLRRTDIAHDLHTARLSNPGCAWEHKERWRRRRKESSARNKCRAGSKAPGLRYSEDMLTL